MFYVRVTNDEGFLFDSKEFIQLNANGRIESSAIQNNPQE